ncbi:MAG: helicase-related protein, partial [Clostridium sp.]|uniref:helicase-related protein n=1 Tax=Clostridium sp. TaxID=1506 RepID=UPI003F30B004
MSEVENKLGFIFELGFNTGILRECIRNKEVDISLRVANIYTELLKDSSTKRETVIKRITKEVIDDDQKEILKDNIDFYMMKGLLAGESFFKELIESRKREGQPCKVEYFQCSLDCKKFKGEEIDEEQYYKELLKVQLEVEIDEIEYSKYKYKGKFINADSLILFSSRDKYHLCVVDNAISLKNIVDYRNVDIVKGMYGRDIAQKRMKSNFKNLAIDMSSNKLDLKINKQICDYIIGLSSKNKSVFKMIQAGSYANSFMEFLEKNKPDIYEKIETITIVGYTDSEINSINLEKKDFKLIGEKENRDSTADNIKTFNEIIEELKNFGIGYEKSDRSGRESTLEIKRKRIYQKIRKNFKEKFKAENTAELLELQKGINRISIVDYIENFQNTSGEFKGCSFRDVHANEIKKHILDKDLEIMFLTGNPGIGKTTAIIETLKKQESYLLMYVSPRTQVNKDIEQKLLKNEDEPKEGLYDDEVVYLTADSNDETEIDGKSVDVVNFNSNNKNIFDEIENNLQIKFLDASRKREKNNENGYFTKINVQKVEIRENNNKGVLNRLTRGIKEIIDNDVSNKIVATAAVQSLKVIGKNKKTTNHFNRIFYDVYDDENRCLNVEEYKKLARKYKNIIFMIDEITGDSSGVEFLSDIVNLLIKNIKKQAEKKEIKEKINFKIIVADASITSKDVVNMHLGNANVESDKFYYKQVEKEECRPIHTEKFKFKRRYDSVIINTNSYPAKRLRVEYKPFINVLKYNEEELGLYDAVDEINREIIVETFDFIENNKDEQIIIYIQDIQRLIECEAMIEAEWKKRWKKEAKKNEDYIIINSTMSDKDRDSVFKVKEKAKIVLMTSSASRGISFKKATCILVDLPQFDVEKNMMEILQLIYRGRGNKDIDLNKEKVIKFFINDRCYFKDEENLKDKLGEMSFRIMTLMLILKLSIETRVLGAGKLNKNYISLIPIGGKSINSIEEFFTEEMAGVMKNIKKEIIKNRDDVYLQDANEGLEVLLGNLKIETENEIFQDNISQNNVYEVFISSWNKSMKELLEVELFKNCYVLGNILLFRVSNKVESNLEMLRYRLVGKESKELLRKLFTIYKDEKYSDSFRNGIFKAYRLVKYFKENNLEENTMHLNERKAINSRYIAIPL